MVKREGFEDRLRRHTREVLPHYRVSQPPSSELPLPLGDDYRLLQGRKSVLYLPENGKPVEPLPSISVTIHGDQDLRVDLFEPVNHAGCAKVWRAARPGRPNAGASQECDDCLWYVWEIRRDSIPLLHPHVCQRRRHGGGPHLEFLPTHIGTFFPALASADDCGATVLLLAKDVLRVIQLRTREPQCARHLPS